MKVMEALQALPAVQVGCECDDNQSSGQQSLSSASHDSPSASTVDQHVADSVFRDGSPRIRGRLQPPPAPLTATRSFPLAAPDLHCAHTALASSLSTGSQRKLHQADDDDLDEDIERLAASIHFDESSDDEDSKARRHLASAGPPAGRKQSDCTLPARAVHSQLTTLVREHAGDGRQNCRRTASFPIAHSPVDGASRHCSHHGSHASSLAGIPLQIVPNLFIGDETASTNEPLLRSLNVTHVVNVTKRIPNWHEKGGERPLKYFQVPVNDHWSENLLPFLPQVIEFIDSARRNDCSALIHCEAGVSRSATIIVAYVMHTFRMKLDDAYEMVRKVKSDICPNFAFMMQLKDFEKQLGLECT